MKVVNKGWIYKAKRGHEHSKKYNCFMPMFTGRFDIVDCWYCDEHGNIDNGYFYGTPINTSNIGKLVEIPFETTGRLVARMVEDSNRIAMSKLRRKMKGDI